MQRTYPTMQCIAFNLTFFLVQQMKSLTSFHNAKIYYWLKNAKWPALFSRTLVSYMEILDLIVNNLCFIFKNFFWPQCLVKTGSFGENDRLLSGDTCRTSESRFCNGHFMSLMNALISFSQGNKTLTKREKKKLAECSDYIQDVLKSKKVRHT